MKYFLTENKQEIKVGDKVKLSHSVETPYGSGKTIVEVEVTEPILNKLVEDGLVTTETEPPTKADLIMAISALKPYFRRIARKYDLKLPEVLIVLSVILRFSKRAHLTILLETIAEVKNRDKDFKGERFYLNPLKGYKPTPTKEDSEGEPMFARADDALDAYKLLLPLIKDILNGKQED